MRTAEAHPKFTGSYKRRVEHHSNKISTQKYYGWGKNMTESYIKMT